MTDKKVLYFGYGANKDSEMIKAIIGRKPQGEKAIAENYELFLQKINDTPKKVQKMLYNFGWDKKFKTYCIRPSKNKETEGTLWKMSSYERKLIGKWEMHGIWYKPIKIKIKTSEKKAIIAETEIIDSKKQKGINKKSYKAFPNNKQKMLRIARKIRYL